MFLSFYLGKVRTLTRQQKKLHLFHCSGLYINIYLFYDFIYAMDIRVVCG